MTLYAQVTTTTESKADAQSLAGAIVESSLAACVQIIGPITSTYRWRGKIETAEEWLCVIKSKGELYEELEGAIRAVHAYQEPEIIATKIVKGSAGYLAWLDENTR